MKIGKKEKGYRACKCCTYAFPVGRFRCPSCGTWDTGGPSATPDNDQTVLLGAAAVAPLVQLQTGPWDPCFGQQRNGREVVVGIVNTGVTLLGGAPGAGKSTLSLQLAVAIIAATKREILYIEAEESTEELKARAVRLGIPLETLNKIRVVPMGSSAELAEVLMRRKPSAIIVDSLQGLCDTDLEAQVEFCKALKDYTIPLKAPAIVISHITKGEEFAGLMALQHAVDTTILFQVDDDGVRLIRSVKNRFGPSNIERMFNMTEEGLVLREESEDEDEYEE